MNIRMYAIYDVKALTYAPPFLANTDGIAVRMLRDLVEDNSNMVGRHPADFRLYCVGGFDIVTGITSVVSPAEHVIDAVALVPTNELLPLERAAQ